MEPSQVKNALFLLVLTIVSTCQAEPSSPIIELKSGKVQGIVQDAVGVKTGKVNFFQGIKYGKANRFERSKPADSWANILNATHAVPACIQFDNSVHADLTQSEDCLLLNVWQPTTAIPTSNLSVMVFIHGGGFSGGYIKDITLRHFANDGNVVGVAIQYRLGPLGFLHTSAAMGHEMGNYGLYDQLLALEWVRDNIAKFGGNPADVTIFGESAGSWSVTAQILSPLAKGLFHRGIMQSGSVSTQVLDQAEALKYAGWFAGGMNCPTDAGMLTCLKGKTAAELQKTQIYIAHPIYGEAFFPLKPSIALRTGKFNHVDLIFGNANNEGADFLSFVKPEGKAVTIKEAKDDLAKYFAKEGGQEVSDYYLGKLKADATLEEIEGTIAKAIADGWMVCPTTLFGEEMAKAGGERKNFFAYRIMEIKRPNGPSWKFTPHSNELAFIFNWELPAQFSLARNMVHTWTTFAKTGRPGKLGTLDWPEAFTDHAHPQTQYMALKTDAYQVVAKQYVEMCDTFWKPRLLA